MALARLRCLAPQIDHPGGTSLLNVTIKTRPPPLRDLSGEALTDLQLRPQPQPFGGNLGGSLSHATGDVVAGDDQVIALVRLDRTTDRPPRTIIVMISSLSQSSLIGWSLRCRLETLAPAIRAAVPQPSLPYETPAL